MVLVMKMGFELLLVWPITQDLFVPGDPARGKMTQTTAPGMIRAHKLPHHDKVTVHGEGIYLFFVCLFIFVMQIK